MSLIDNVSILWGTSWGQNAPHNNYVPTNHKSDNIHTDVTMCARQRERVFLSWNPNDRIAWLRPMLPRWQAPWICDRERETGEQRQSERDKRGRKTDSVWSCKQENKLLRASMILAMTGENIEVDYTQPPRRGYLNKIYIAQKKHHIKPKDFPNSVLHL